jgi:hypothetical protein
MSFNIGNAIKYLWRADEKGAPIQDLKKAAWYINREIRRREASVNPEGVNRPNPNPPSPFPTPTQKVSP